jgi:hypothetical protein
MMIPALKLQPTSLRFQISHNSMFPSETDMACCQVENGMNVSDDALHAVRCAFLSVFSKSIHLTLLPARLHPVAFKSMPLLCFDLT